MPGHGGASAVWVVDRLEGDFVVVEIEGGRTIDLPRTLLPPELVEGSVLRVAARGDADGWSIEVRADPEEQEARRRDARARLERLRARDPGGDIEL